MRADRNFSAMRILLFSTLFPNAAAPAHGVFVENRLNAYRRKYDAEVKVIAPVPWFPFRHPVFGHYAKWASAPSHEIRNDVEVLHPRYLIPPKIAMSYAPYALTRCLRKATAQLIASGWDFDLIDAHYFYPDGVAAARVAHELGKPLVITARGTDINLIPNFPEPREKVLDAAWRADAIITVADALKNELKRLGAPPEKTTVLRNGVDLELFRPADREAERRALGLDGLVLLSVGHLIERKGHDLVIEALKDVDGATLLIVGDGPERASLEARAVEIGVADRVRFLGQIEHEELYCIYNAADIFVLASAREGWPNVLLEAMACGTPCVATDVWGSGEVLRASDGGRLVKERTAPAIATAIKNVLAVPPGRKTTRTYAEKHSWDETAAGINKIFSDLSEKVQAESAITTTPVKFDGTYRPRLIVTIDTEEQFDWREFDKVEYLVNDPEDIDRFQNVCSDFGARPLYFLTWPILKDERCASYFKNLHGQSLADCGLHLHQWATPPCDYNGEYYSFQKNLPGVAHSEKLKALADIFTTIFGERANTHRAGRYGVSKGNYKLLNEIGIEFDFSPSASFDFSSRGGPDFSRMSNAPFSVGEGDWRVFVTPVCGANALRGTQMFMSQKSASPGFALPSTNRFNKVKKAMRVSPEGATLSDLKALTRRLVFDQTPVLTFTLHSTSLSVGGNPYSKESGNVDELLTTTASYFEWFQETMGGEIVSLADLQTLYRKPSPA